MRKFVVFLAMSFIMPLALIAQNANPTPPAPADNPNAPEISFDQTTHDYGTILQGSDGTCEFKFTNTGKEPLILQKPVSSCGCTVPTWPQEPILPGKSDVIKVTYATHNVGPFQKTITVTSNAKTSRVLLTIKGTVQAKPTDQTPEKKTEDNGATPIQK
ncbi:MAG TPA: DUF1573 domain-containing protein [Bacteroidales bacterium]|nr:DUF1573 domain-containing protein [Bacteroidales bacterium]